MVNAGERLPGTPEPMHVWRTADGLRIAAGAILLDSWFCLVTGVGRHGMHGRRPDALSVRVGTTQ